MGSLHEGHLSLVRTARAECATVVVSNFVNPTQFESASDFSNYPRDPAGDLDKLAAETVDIVFAPSPAEMHPQGFAVTVKVDGPALPLEGRARPGHFDGVATVVAKLLSQAAPDRVYFGQKDGQQVAVVRRVVADLDIATRVIALPTVREADGLACSSRNVLLSPSQRAAAPVIYRALDSTRKLFAAGRRDAGELEANCRDLIEAEPRIEAIEYVAAVDPVTMAPWPGTGQCMLAVAVRLGKTRLIDNVILEQSA